MSSERIAVAANSALVKVARRLEESERWLRTIADNVPAQIVYVDESLRYRFCNRVFEQVHGLAPGGALGKTVREIAGDGAWTALEAHALAALAGHSVTFDREEYLRTGTLHFQVSYVPDIREDGKIAGFHGLIHDVTESKRVAAELQRLARHDPLTGLPNRALFAERLQQAQSRTSREGQLMALLFLDLDRFKVINDRLGHGAGDEVLCEFGRRLESCVRCTDTVARIAGDEFVVILEGLHEADEAEHVAAKILAAMKPLFLASGNRIDVRTSIGIAMHSGAPVEPDALVARADAALYDAKAAGRNSFRVSTSMPHDTQPRPLRRARLSATSKATSSSSRA